MRHGIEDHGDDFTLAVEPVDAGSPYAVGGDFDSTAAEVTDWYRRTDEDGNHVPYDYETGEFLDEDSARQVRDDLKEDRAAGTAERHDDGQPPRA